MHALIAILKQYAGGENYKIERRMMTLNEFTSPSFELFTPIITIISHETVKMP